jgi:hypothetical protein
VDYTCRRRHASSSVLLHAKCRKAPGVWPSQVTFSSSPGKTPCSTASLPSLPVCLPLLPGIALPHALHCLHLRQTKEIVMSTIKSYAAKEAGADLSLWEYDAGELLPQDVEVQVEYCGSATPTCR